MAGSWTSRRPAAIATGTVMASEPASRLEAASLQDVRRDRRTIERERPMWYWLNFARQDLFPTRGPWPYSLFSWLPGLVLVFAVATLVGLELVMDTALRGAREKLEDPKILRRVPLDALREGRPEDKFFDEALRRK